MIALNNNLTEPNSKMEPYLLANYLFEQDFYHLQEGCLIPLEMLEKQLFSKFSDRLLNLTFFQFEL